MNRQHQINSGTDNKSSTEQKITVPVYKYLDIDSTYRNRNNYPNPNDFVIPLNYPGRNSSASTAIDPVVDAIPYTGSDTKTPGELETQAGSTTTAIILDPSEPDINNYYINSILQIGTQYVTITGYTGSTQTAVVSPALASAPGAGVVYYTRKGQPIFTGTVSATITPTTTTFSLNAAASSTDGIYVNNYVYFTSGADIGQSALIISYTGATRQVTLLNALPVAPAIGDSLEIDPFSYDNASTLIYSSNVTQNRQTSYYEIELLWLIVPNITLNVGYGGTLDSYPYIYLSLYNEATRQTNQVLYSNNPNSPPVLFKIPVNEYFGDTSFLTLKDARSRQVIPFHPDLDIHFTLSLPDGTPISYDVPDDFSPEAPNPLVQVNALFAMRRVT